jgi:hypothetical protein
LPFELLHSPCGPSHLSQELSRLTLGHPTHYGCTNIVHLSVCSAILGWRRSNTLFLLSAFMSGRQAFRSSSCVAACPPAPRTPQEPAVWSGKDPDEEDVHPASFCRIERGVACSPMQALRQDCAPTALATLATMPTPPGQGFAGSDVQVVRVEIGRKFACLPGLVL